MALIQEYVSAIIENLPEWNHREAKDDPNIGKQISLFKKASSQIDSSLSLDAQLKALSDIIQKYVPDNHVAIRNGSGKNLKIPVFSHEPQNLSSQNLEKLDITDIVSIPVQKREKPWIIGTLLNKKAGIVSIPSFGGEMTEQTAQRRLFIDTFFKQKHDHQWQNIIFDFRGNTGGDSEIIKEIAERMGNHTVKYADKSETPDTPIAQKRKRESRPLGDYLKKGACYKPYVPTDKFSGSIYILQDEYNASATEGAIYMLSQLPKVTTIGEKTSGTFSGGATSCMPMSYGSLIIGTEYRERYDRQGNQIKEKEGMAPDVVCPSEQSFTKALEMLSQKSERIKMVGTDFIR